MDAETLFQEVFVFQNDYFVRKKILIRNNEHVHKYYLYQEHLNNTRKITINISNQTKKL